MRGARGRLVLAHLDNRNHQFGCECCNCECFGLWSEQENIAAAKSKRSRRQLSCLTADRKGGKNDSITVQMMQANVQKILSLPKMVSPLIKIKKGHNNNSDEEEDFINYKIILQLPLLLLSTGSSYRIYSL